ncbi:hypothetical protein DW817_05080 [Acidaminococcus sp. AM33-14BH]|nr:hypothetical protein DW817_05080 [Acidaminococcus sp. AM33-14BH]
MCVFTLQLENKRTVLTCAAVLKQKGWQVSHQDPRKSAAKIIEPWTLAKEEKNFYRKGAPVRAKGKEP